MNIWKHDSTADMSGWEFCLCVFEQAMLSSCITFPFASDNIHETETFGKGEAKGQVGGGGTAIQATETVCRCRLVAYAHC